MTFCVATAYKTQKPLCKKVLRLSLYNEPMSPLMFIVSSQADNPKPASHTRFSPLTMTITKPLATAMSNQG